MRGPGFDKDSAPICRPSPPFTVNQADNHPKSDPFRLPIIAGGAAPTPDGAD